MSADLDLDHLADLFATAERCGDNKAAMAFAYNDWARATYEQFPTLLAGARRLAAAEALLGEAVVGGSAWYGSEQTLWCRWCGVVWEMGQDGPAPSHADTCLTQRARAFLATAAEGE